MGVMIVEANPVRVGKLAFRLRWGRDAANTVANTPTPAANSQADKDYKAFTTGIDADKMASMHNAGIREKINTQADPADNEVQPVDGSELAVVFDEDPAAQQAAQNRTVMVIPTAADLQFLWGIDGGNLFQPAQRRKVTKEDYAELGRYLLKRCR